MKLTNRKVVNDANFLESLIHRQFPVKVSYAISKNVSKLERELKIYNSERQKIINKYCKKDEEGNLVIDENNQYHIEDENIDVLDEDELIEALENGKINKNEYELAITKKNELIDSLINDNNKYIKIDFFKYL